MTTPFDPPHTEAAAGTDRLALALMRIEQSRAALRERLIRPPSSTYAGPAGASAPQRWLGTLRHWLRSTPLAPLATPAWAALRGWWRRQRWHTTGEAAGRIVSSDVVSLVRRHPVIAVGTVAAAGAALVVARRRHPSSARRGLASTPPWWWRQLSQPAVKLALATALATWVNHKAASGGSSGSGTEHDLASSPARTGAAPR